LLTEHDYVEEERFLTGDATSYRPEGEWGADGRWSAVVGAAAPYATRVLVRRPRDIAQFNGTVLVEWLNVTSLFDLAIDFGYLNEELLDRGVVYIGVSAQNIGVQSAKAENPARYGSLQHPGDEFSYDIFTQAGRAVLADRLLPAGFAVERLVADGESQSAGRLTTYINAVQPLVDVYDGFLVHSRSDRMVGVVADQQIPAARIRTDLRTPTLVVLTETDVLGNQRSAQDDDDRYRRWEIAGSAHLDNYAMAVLTGNDPTQPAPAGKVCEKPMNDAHQWWVMNAGFRHLEAWVGGGPPPPSAPRMAVGPDGGYVTDQDGNATGGIRLPDVEVPTSRLKGLGNAPSWCRLFGSTEPLSADRLAARYPSPGQYREAYVAAARRLVDVGFMVERDLASATDHAERMAATL
jgi:hypothetical protein